MKTKLLIVCLSCFWGLYQVKAQYKLEGTVKDYAEGVPLIGATVAIKENGMGALTDDNGKFTLKFSGKLPVTVICRYVGYQLQTITVNDLKPLTINLEKANTNLNEVIVTARRRTEEIQEIPLAIAVVGAKELDNSLSFNVNRVKELVPSVQLYTSNPRNTTLNIRGLGSTFGLTNDGIDPGVGFYVDGVYYARPAAASLDFIDVQQIEVIRGPQGTLFGKNTTAGTFNITSRKPTFTPTGIYEQSFGNFGFIQTKGSFSAPLWREKLAFRLSFSGTHRDGTIYNTSKQQYTNTLNNQGIKVQWLFQPIEKINLTLIADYTRQRPNGYALVYAGTAPTLRPSFRQFNTIIADLNYSLPNTNPFKRRIDHDTPWRSDQDMGGISLNVDLSLGKGKLTSTSAWRKWVWGPSNDRDFTGLQALRLSQAPSIHNQWSQEIRYAGDFLKNLSGVIGAFAFYQDLKANGAHVEESGKDQWRFVQTTQNPLWQTPGLLDGYGIKTTPNFNNFSGALFAQLDYKLNKKLTMTPGIRFNYDQKRVDFNRQTYGGLQTTDSALLALKRLVYTNQSFKADVSDRNISGQLTLAYSFTKQLKAYTTYAFGFKPIGLNLGGLPTSNGIPMTDLAVIKPERVRHFEIGIKSELRKKSALNLTFFNTQVFDYQTLVQSPELGVNRGFLANAEHISVFGIEIETNIKFNKFFSFNSSISYTEGKYVSFKNAPLPLEETGKRENGKEIAFKDISGGALPGISKWAFSNGFEACKHASIFQLKGEIFFNADWLYRSSFSSSPTPSAYLNINGYHLINSRVGFRTSQGVSFLIWCRNLANVNYFEQLLPAAGNAGQYAGVLSDPRTYGITLRYNFN